MSQDNPTITSLAIALAVVAGSLVVGCDVWRDTPSGPESVTDDCEAVLEYLSGWGQGLSVGLPNPAAVYCHQIGGELRTEESERGQIGICVLPDGTEREEWDLFCGDCEAPAYCSPSYYD